ncbi:MAG TPA: hypothetical protein VHM26_02970 [Chitinophagaceae bacterium]|jgi:hypothetical protein|nr:hypothetical protein [Chitinophagaceae bacterium]
MKHLFACLFAGAFFIACTNNDRAKEPGESPATISLVMEDFEIRYKDVAGIRVSKDGKIYQGTDSIGSIDIHGTVKNRDGHTVAKFNKDTLISLDDNTRARISEEGAIDNGSGTVMLWSADGKLMNGTTETGYTITPVDTKARRTASIVVFHYLLFN